MKVHTKYFINCTVCYLPVPHKDPPKVDLGWTDHVPHGDAPVLAAGDHHPVLEVEAEMEHGLAVVDQGVDHLSRLDVPHPHSAITRPRDYHLKTEIKYILKLKCETVYKMNVRKRV